MNMIMNNNLPLLNQEFKTPVYNDYLDIIKELIQKCNGDKSLPTSQEELDIFTERKTPILNKYLKINLTKKKKNTARDIISDFFYDTKDGYQELKGRWVKCYEQVIKSLENAKESPEKMFVVMNSGEEFRYLINNKVDIICGATDWNYGCLHDIDDEDYWSDMTGEQHETLEKAYMISQMVIESNSNGTGFYHEDMNYMKETMGFNVIGKKSTDYKELDNDGDLIVLMMTRPSDKTLCLIIDSLKILIKRLKVTEKKDVIIEGYSGELEPLIPILEEIIPSSEVMSFSGKSPMGVGKNITIVINNITNEQVFKVEDCLLSNNKIYVGHYGEKCFYNIGRDYSDWYYLTGKQEEPNSMLKKLKK